MSKHNHILTTNVEGTQESVGVSSTKKFGQNLMREARHNVLSGCGHKKCYSGSIESGEIRFPESHYTQVIQIIECDTDGFVGDKCLIEASMN